MTATVTLELPESVLIQALRKLPPARRYELLRRIDNEALRVKPGTDVNQRLEQLPALTPERTRALHSTLNQALGLLVTERAAPTDLEIEQMLAERRWEKYGNCSRSRANLPGRV